MGEVILGAGFSKGGSNSSGSLDPRLFSIMSTAASLSPYNVVFQQGVAARSTGTINHPSGWAMDIQLQDPATGKLLPNDGPSAKPYFKQYEQYAQTARIVQQQAYPELNSTFRWGGPWTAARGNPSGSDYEHFDINPGKGGVTPGSMGSYTWDNGFGNGGLNANSRFVDQVQQQYANMGAGIMPPSGIAVADAAPVPATDPRGLDLSSYSGSSPFVTSAVKAITEAAPTNWGDFYKGILPQVPQIASANAPGQIGQTPPSTPIPQITDQAGAADFYKSFGLPSAPTTPQGPSDTPITDQASAAGFYKDFGLPAPISAPTGIASTNAPGQVGQSPTSPPLVGSIGTASAPPTFPARPGLIAPNGSTPYASIYGAPANPVHVTPYTPGTSVADLNLNDLLYPNGQPTYKSSGALPDVPSWAIPSVPVSLTTPQPGSSSTVVNGAINGAIRNAAPQIQSALEPAFGGAKSFLDWLSPPANAAPVTTAPPSAFPARPSYPSPNNTTGYSSQAATGNTVPFAQSNYGNVGYSGNSSYSPSSYLPSAINTGSSSVAMNDPGGSGNTYSQPKTISVQQLNPAWTQWQAQTTPSDGQFSGIDTGLSWAGLNTGDASNPFSSFASPANIPATPPPQKYITINKPNPAYVAPPLAYPTGGNPVANWFNGRPIGHLLSLFGNGQNASDMLFGGGSTGLPTSSIPQLPGLLQTGLTPQQRNVSTPAYIAAVNAGQTGYTPAGSNTWMPTTTINGGFRQSYGDSGSSGSLSSRG